ncbi:MAG TPA: glycosyltransferase family 2 protein [Gemmatimonadaceae bacterium]|nr:glycosyltransferase family 2 protein [Gemmatimonadaceae bacterium]
MYHSRRAARPLPRPEHALPHFTLVVATIGRVDAVDRFLASVVGQEYPNVDIVVADQNADGRLAPVLAARRRQLDIRHLRTARGLSRARNIALEYARGDVIAFPDDDCTYPPGLLHSLAFEFQRYPLVGGLVGCPVADDTGRRFRGFSSHRAEVTPANVWRLCCSIGLFLRKSVVEMVGGFDESLGVGAGTPWGAAEDRDYPLRALDLGVRMHYDPELKVLHPPGDYTNLARAYSYGAGLGRVLRKRAAPRHEVCRLLIVRPIAGMILALLRGRPVAAAFYFHSLRGRVAGWRAPFDS